MTAEATNNHNKLMADKVNDAIKQFMSEDDWSTYTIEIGTFDKLNNLITDIEALYESTFDPSSKKTQDLEFLLINLRQLLQEFSKMSEEDIGEGKIQVCSSNLYQKTPAQSDWSSRVLVGCNISYTKMIEIGPSVSDPERSVLNLIFKYKGLQSNVNPLVIPIQEAEFKDFVNGSIIMFTLFNSKALPVKLNGIDSCMQLLSETQDWTQIGQLILDQFDLSPENIGEVFKNHISSMIQSQIKIDQAELKSTKRKSSEQSRFDCWNNRQKRYAIHSKKRQTEEATKGDGE